MGLNQCPGLMSESAAMDVLDPHVKQAGKEQIGVLRQLIRVQAISQVSLALCASINEGYFFCNA